MFTLVPDGGFKLGRLIELGWKIGVLCVVMLASSGAQGQGTFRVRFERPVYQVQPGGTVPVNVIIDPIPGSGLFSYGVSVNFDPQRAILELAGITVPQELDFNGVLGAGALKGESDGAAGVKGTINLAGAALKPYAGSVLATFVVGDKSSAGGGSYSLGLSLFKTLGAAESIFVDGTGQVLDDRIGFDSAVVNVVPEPGVSILAVIGVMCWARKAGLLARLASLQSKWPLS